MSDPIVIDAENLVLGRMATETASILLKKKPYITAESNSGEIEVNVADYNGIVHIVNIEKAIISGTPTQITARYLQRIHIKTNTNPRRGPFHPRTPENIVRRSIRGMVPHRKKTGKDAMSRLRVYCGVPEKLTNSQRIRFHQADASKFNCKRISVGELARRIGSYQTRVRRNEK